MNVGKVSVMTNSRQPSPKQIMMRQKPNWRMQNISTIWVAR